MMPQGSQSPHSMRTKRVLTSIPALGSARRHAQRSIETDDLPVEIGVLDDMAGKRSELIGAAERLGEGNSAGEALLRFLGDRHQHGGAKNARSNADDANAELGEFARGRQG